MTRSLAVPAAALALVLAGCAARQPPRPAAAPEPGMMVIPRGDFTMGGDEGPLNEQPAHEVKLDTYYLDRTEVSAADFAAFLNEVGNPGGRHFTSDEFSTVVETAADGRSRFAPRAGAAALPANNVSWHGADAYCRWRGRRLPTEAEWEKGARGRDERRYPWGDGEPDDRRARFAQTWEGLRHDVLMPVDALPDGASAYGLLNMGGNVLEWVADWYRQNLCDFCNPDVEANLELLRLLTGEDEAAGRDVTEAGKRRQAPPRDNPAGPSVGLFKVLRGGSWQERDPDDLAATRRFWLDPAQRFPHTGFRCAKDPTDSSAGQARP